MIKELFYYVGKDNELTDTNIRNETEKTHLRHYRNVWTFNPEEEDVQPRRSGRSDTKNHCFGRDNPLNALMTIGQVRFIDYFHSAKRQSDYYCSIFRSVI